MDRDWLCEIAAASCKWCMKWEILPSAQRIWMCYVTRRALHRYTRFISVRAAAGKASKAQRPALTWCKSPVKLMANSPDSKRRQRTEMCKVSRRWGGGRRIKRQKQECKFFCKNHTLSLQRQRTRGIKLQHCKGSAAVCLEKADLSSSIAEAGRKHTSKEIEPYHTKQTCINTYICWQTYNACIY